MSTHIGYYSPHAKKIIDLSFGIKLFQSSVKYFSHYLFVRIFPSIAQFYCLFFFFLHNLSTSFLSTKIIMALRSCENVQVISTCKRTRTGNKFVNILIFEPSEFIRTGANNFMSSYTKYIQRIIIRTA